MIKFNEGANVSNTVSGITAKVTSTTYLSFIVLTEDNRLYWYMYDNHKWEL